MSAESFEVIDFHGHQGRWDGYMPHDDPRKIIAVLDKGGIDRACLFNVFHSDVKDAHDALAKVVREYAGRFIGFAYATPHCPDMVNETRRAIDDLGFRAIKIYPPYGDIRLTDKRWAPLFEFANERGLAVISHTGIEPSCEPKYFDDIAPLYPRLNFVIGHSGNVEPQRTQAINAARKWANVYLETCSTYRSPGVIEQLVAGAGEDRLLFGSDLPLLDPRSQMGKIVTARISDKAKQKILGANARRLLRL